MRADMAQLTDQEKQEIIRYLAKRGQAVAGEVSFSAL